MREWTPHADSAVGTDADIAPELEESRTPPSFSTSGQLPAVAADHESTSPTASELAYGRTSAPASATANATANNWPAPPLWAKGPGGKSLPPSIADVRQQLNEDCYLFAAMAAIVQTDPQAIVDMIKPNGDDTYTVTFKGPMQPQAYAGTGPTPAPAATPATPITVAWNKDGKRDYSMEGYRALWPLLVEKAYAQMLGAGVLTRGNPGRAMATMTGKSFMIYRPAEMAPEELMEVLSAGRLAGTPMTAGMKPLAGGQVAMFPGKPGFWSMHAYAVVDVDASGQRVKLFNPKPADKAEHTHPNGTGWVSISEFREYVSELDANR